MASSSASRVDFNTHRRMKLDEALTREIADLIRIAKIWRCPNPDKVRESDSTVLQSVTAEKSELKSAIFVVLAADAEPIYGSRYPSLSRLCRDNDVPFVYMEHTADLNTSDDHPVRAIAFTREHRNWKELLRVIGLVRQATKRANAIAKDIRSSPQPLVPLTYSAVSGKRYWT
jgi:ribosomal protein L7Ae-like RNA K-turn-binding protein